MTKEEAVKWLKTTMDNYDFFPETEEVLKLAVEALSGDKVEVVRCGECKHIFADGRCEEFADDGIRPSASDFCSYGERKEK